MPATPIAGALQVPRDVIIFYDTPGDFLHSNEIVSN